MAVIGAMLSSDFPSEQDLALYMGILQEPSMAGYCHEDIFILKTSKQRQEKFSRVGGWGLFAAKPIGAPSPADSTQEMYFKYIAFKTYAKRFDFAMETIQDDPKGIISKIMDQGTQLSGQWEYTKEQLHWSYLISRWSTATAAVNLYPYAGSYYPIYSTAHPTLIPGLTFSNRFTNSTQLNRATLESAILQMIENPLNAKGLQEGIVPTRILVGTNNRFNAQRLISNTGVPYSNDNGPNVIADHIRRVISPTIGFPVDGYWSVWGPKEDSRFYTFNRMSLQNFSLSQNSTLNTTKVAAARFGMGGIESRGTFGNVPA